jgi:hypothetical protein
MQRPIQVMTYKINQLLNPGSSVDDKMEKVKYMIYSAHDDQIINTMIWLQPSNYEMKFAPFAANV